jgi:hypothetical protein
MAASKDHVICHVCGFKNAPEAERCVSCGAKLEELSGSYSAEEEAKKRTQQGGFAVRWALISFVVYLALQTLVLVALPYVIDVYDPQGFSALMISMGVWFVGGVIVGFISPGKTFIEPAVGALFAVVPTVWWLVSTTPQVAVGREEQLGGGFQLTMPAYVIGGLLGGMISLFGAFVGEKLQDTRRGKGKRARA